MTDPIKVRIPATTANLGPGFDCLGMALDLWNEVTFSLEGKGIYLNITGEGETALPRNANNLIASSTLKIYQHLKIQPPSGLQIVCHNAIPLSSGLGSSSAAALAGLIGGNKLLGNPLTDLEILALATEIEGHPDNAAAALYRGLVAVTRVEDTLVLRNWPVPNLRVAVAIPQINVSTRQARAALPGQVSTMDAVYNIGRSILVVEALRTGDLMLLGQVMEDRLHHPYRLPIMPGASAAFTSARQAGASAVALSGAGPGVIAFGQEACLPEVVQAMVKAFADAGISSRGFILGVSNPSIAS